MKIDIIVGNTKYHWSVINIMKVPKKLTILLQSIFNSKGNLLSTTFWSSENLVNIYPDSS